MPGRNETKLLSMCDHVERGSVAFCTELVASTVDELQRATPVKTGHARARYAVGVGSLPPGFPEKTTQASYSAPDPRQVAESGMRGFKPGDSAFLTDIAGHSLIIALGRRRGPSGRMLGSLQAPDPYIESSVEAASRRMVNWRFQG